MSSQAVGSPLGNHTEVDVHVVDGNYECAVCNAILGVPDVTMPDVTMPEIEICAGSRIVRILRIEGVEVHRIEVGQ